MSHAQPQGYQYNIPCVEETRIWMFIPNVVHPFAEAINKSVQHIWNEYPNDRFFHTWHIILAYSWLCIGHRILALTFLIFNRWKENLKRRLSACSDRPLPLKIWKYYRKRNQHGKKQKGRIRWDRVALTSAYNVDDKVKKSNGNSTFDTNALVPFDCLTLSLTL